MDELREAGHPEKAEKLKKALGGDSRHLSSQICEKFWADVPGIYIHAQELEQG